MLFDSLVSTDFANKVQAISSSLGINPDYLMACMGFETGYTYKPDILCRATANTPTKQAVGILQFLPSTCCDLLDIKRPLGVLKYSDEQLLSAKQQFADMDNLTQLDYVKKYFEKVQKHYKDIDWNLGNLYCSMFQQTLLNKPLDYKIGQEAYNSNSGLDTTNKGYITKQDICNFIITKTNDKASSLGYDKVADSTSIDFINKNAFKNITADILVNGNQLTDITYNQGVLIAGGFLIIIIIASIIKIILKKK
jgi:hypothetical protein